MYFKELPEINTSNYFMVKTDAHTTLVSDWLDYIDFIVQNFGLETTTNNKNYFSKLKQTYIGGSKNFNTTSEKVKETLGLGGDFQVLTEKRTQNGYEYVATINYDELTNMFFSKELLKSRYIQRQQIIDKFFLYQWAKGKILYPLYLDRTVINRTVSNKEFMIHANVYQQFCQWIDDKKFDDPNTASLMKSTFLTIIISTSWMNIKDITENGIYEAEQKVFEHQLATASRGRTLLYVLNELRRMLIFFGRKDIKEPLSTKYKSGASKAEPFDFVDLQINPNLEDILIIAKRFLNVCELDGLSKGTIKHIRLALNHLFRYFILHCKGEKITVEIINRMFHPDNQTNLRKYLLEQNIKALSQIMQQIIRFLDYAELASNFAKNHVPKFKKQPTMPLRKAMSVEMLRDLKDILMNRPPNPMTKWKSDAIDMTSWWKHTDIYPIFPLMVLFHLMIPIRGGQLRHLCRENSFIADEMGKNIESFVINTDKNVNRKNLQTIENVWDDLNIFNDFLQWHFKYFRNLLPIKYKDDDNAPWEEIYPLFILPGKYKPISERTHYAYVKKLFCIYQIEKNNQLIQEGKTPYVNIVSRNDGKAVFTNLHDAQNASLSIFDKEYKAIYDVHSFRVTGVTRYLEAGLNFKMVMMLTGHKTPAMVLDTYNRLEYHERQALLSSAYKKVFLGIGENLVENTKRFVHEELGELYQEHGSDGLENGFKQNGLFSLHRKDLSNVGSTETTQLGTVIAKNSEPSSWFPMIHGICPGVQCPEGRQKKCSLCPYLITGRIFLDGVIHQSNISLVKFFRVSRDFDNEISKKHYENKPKGELLESVMEEILGWNEIIQTIQNNLNAIDDESNNVKIKNGKLPIISLQNNGVGQTITLPEELIYLENEYKASIMGVESDNESLSMLTIMAFQLAKATGDDSIYTIANDSKKVIDFLMGHYNNHKKINNVESFLGMMKGIIPLKLSNK